MRAKNIIWDANSPDDLVNLPTEIEIPVGMTDEDEISDYISDITGFCHKGFKLKNDELEEQAIKDFKELLALVNENQHLTIKELCQKLDGHNLCEDFEPMFDINYKSICATVHYGDNKFYLSNHIEIWDDEECYLYDDDFNIEENLYEN